MDDKIEVQAPLPGPLPARPTPTLYPFADLKPGEWFFIPYRTTNTFSPYASRRGKELGMKFSTQLARMVKENDKWRLPNPGEPVVRGIVVCRVE